ncbi:MAG: biotin transporter BioY [Gammaproteobacteria bacterium]|nr:biotin transporter BioY [Gammaproteobacteria bacterium]
MNALFSISSPLQSLFWPKENSSLKQALLLLMGVLILALSAQLSIPLKPVPLTFQTTTVILIGMTYGARLGTLTIAAYLLAGLIGFPVYQGFSYGLSSFFGATCGYLIGFLPAAFLSGFLAQNGWAKNRIKSFAAACLGSGVIFSFGLLVLAQLIGCKAAIAVGLLPFIISEPIKLLAISMIIPLAWKKS